MNPPPTPTAFPAVDPSELVIQLSAPDSLTAWGVADDVIQVWNMTGTHSGITSGFQIAVLVAIIAMFTYLIVKRIQHLSEEKP